MQRPQLPRFAGLVCVDTLASTRDVAASLAAWRARGAVPVTTQRLNNAQPSLLTARPWPRCTAAASTAAFQRTRCTTLAQGARFTMTRRPVWLLYASGKTTQSPRNEGRLIKRPRDDDTARWPFEAQASEDWPGAVLERMVYENQPSPPPEPEPEPPPPTTT